MLPNFQWIALAKKGTLAMAPSKGLNASPAKPQLHPGQSRDEILNFLSAADLGGLFSTIWTATEFDTLPKLLFIRPAELHKLFPARMDSDRFCAARNKQWVTELDVLLRESNVEGFGFLMDRIRGLARCERKARPDARAPIDDVLDLRYATKTGNEDLQYYFPQDEDQGTELEGNTLFANGMYFTTLENHLDAIDGLQPPDLDIARSLIKLYRIRHGA